MLNCGNTCWTKPRVRKQLWGFDVSESLVELLLAPLLWVQRKTVINLKRSILLLALVAIACLGLFYMNYQKRDVPTHPVSSHNYKPPEGYVPNAETAIKIAEAVWEPIYGERINKKKPFVATLNNGIWTVEGTLPDNKFGGVPYIDISKEDGKILRVSHTK